MRVGLGGPRTNTHDIELEPALQELALDLGGDAVETDMAVGEDGIRHGRHWGGCGGQGGDGLQDTRMRSKGGPKRKSGGGRRGIKYTNRRRLVLHYANVSGNGKRRRCE